MHVSVPGGDHAA